MPSALVASRVRIPAPALIIMQAFIATNFMGVFAFGKDGKLVAYKLFPLDPEKIAGKVQESREAR